MRVKAALELAIFCHSWAKLRPATDLLGEATALLRTIWLRPEFPLLIDAHGDVWADSQRLAYAALAPAGVRDDLRESALARLKTSGYLSPLGKSPTSRLEIRYYADKAHIEHGMESYQDLAAESLLARPPTPPVSRGVAYAITHTAFHLSDFGCVDMGLPGDVREQAERVTRSMIGSCARQDLWDLTGELVSTLGCLGGDPLATPAGQAGIRCLMLAQLDNGAIPGRSAANRAQPSLSSAEFFRKAYHTTLVAALMSLIVGQRDVLPAAEDSRGADQPRVRPLVVRAGRVHTGGRGFQHHAGAVGGHCAGQGEAVGSRRSQWRPGRDRYGHAAVRPDRGRVRRPVG
jgi:hypothetical protein